VTNLKNPSVRAQETSRPAFWALAWTQFFGAVNDNIMKVVIVFTILYGAWAGILGKGADAQSYVNYVFTVPFILLSGYAGTFSDRNSKSRVVFWIKLIEIPIVIIAAIGFWTQELWIALFALLALTCQSAYYGPAKYGMIPEIVAARDLSRANGMINMMTNIAVIVGTLLAGQIATYYSPIDVAGEKETVPTLWLPGVVLILFSIAGLAASLFLPRLEHRESAVKYEWNPFGTYYGSLKEINGTPLFTVMFAWSFFYMLAGLALAVLPEYADVLHIDQGEASVLMGVLGVAIGTGCAIAGFVSGDAIRPRLVPVGGMLMAVFFLLLGTVPAHLPELPPYVRVMASTTSLWILGIGISAGFYIVPLQALLQRLTPDNELGRYLGTANGLSFVFFILAAIVYQVIRPYFTWADGSEHPDKIFIVVAALMLLGVVFFVWRVKARGFSLRKLEG
jgi:acyl-[acyl-carrier-protein]-phospholipid O-acyltransferase/long-chain-fatty-acid--[acyl-carrier-protein] ligase